MLPIKEIYCSGFGYTKVWFDDELEASIDEYTLRIKGWNHVPSHKTWGIPVELTPEQLLTAKKEFNQYWKEFNERYPNHTRPTFQLME